ncbi:MAG: DEAD/DEAH box helicase [Planctomycetales bacterium]|nr:DEAD/DEAH box helicase [Planctomycetales bacterium]
MAATKTKSRAPSKEPKRPSKEPKKKVNPFHQRLARLTYYQATKMLGEKGTALIAQGGRFEIETERDVFLGGDLYRVRVGDPAEAVVTITLNSGRNKQLQINCDQCELTCEHMGGALAHLLDAKSTMGLAEPPDPTVPLENLTEKELLQRAIAERSQRAAEEKMTVRSTNAELPWTDYVITSANSGKSYRVALRGEEVGLSYCSCPDFRTNHLGTCKHILHTLAKVEKRFSAAKRKRAYVRKNLSVRVSYQQPLGLLFNIPSNPDPKIQEMIGTNDRDALNGIEMMQRIQALEHAGFDVHVYPDAEEWIQRELVQAQLEQFVRPLRQQLKDHPLRKQLLKVELLPYQLDGIAFAVGAGRAILADDMGLGKTIQGIGVAELLAQQVGIEKVLVVCPASLKSQWKSEIEKFSGRSSQLILGTGEERSAQYVSEEFFTICNYEQVMRDLASIERARWDLIILDEGQRIKNWESKTSQVIRALSSQFALVLSGTPLENRLDELFTVVQFVDANQLGPAYRFFHKHRVVDERGKIIGYRNLDELRSMLQPILLRRRRADVMKQLPERTDEVIRIKPTEEQLAISTGQLRIAAQIAGKKYWTEMDLLRLQKALLLARMAADSSFLCNKEEPEFSSKLERLGELLDGLIADPTRKIVLFSEWRTMLDRIEIKLDSLDCQYVRLDGQVPQKKRPAIVQKFQEDPNCRLILMTNAGSTGLNLQRANTVINVDLPWNPAVLEQRIARAHRMGQKNPVHVYKLVTEDTIEEKLLATLASKQDLADAALDIDSDVSSVTMQSGIADLKQRLERILPPKLVAPVDESQRRSVEQETAAIQQRREKVSAAGGQLLGAALQLVGELIAGQNPAPPPAESVDQLAGSLFECVERDSAGRPKLTISLPDDTALRNLAETLAHLLVPQKSG